MDNFAAMNAVYEKFFKDPKPVSVRIIYLSPRDRIVLFYIDVAEPPNCSAEPV